MCPTGRTASAWVDSLGHTPVSVGSEGRPWRVFRGRFGPNEGGKRVARLRRKERLHLTLPEDLLRAVEVRREREGKHRSEVLEEAVALWLSGRDAEELERRLGIAAKLGDLEELVASLRGWIRDLEIKNLYATERVYALLEAQFAHNPQASREQTNRAAHERIARMRWVAEEEGM